MKPPVRHQKRGRKAEVISLGNGRQNAFHLKPHYPLLAISPIYFTLALFLSIRIPIPISMTDIASSSSSRTCSSSTSYADYDVFINHRGPDVKHTLASTLYRRLNSRGLRVFLDWPELQAGHTIISQIEAAIRSASVHIAIFSETYAESKWCLNELGLMVDSGDFILPVFYHVEPSDLRRTGKDQNGVFAKALRNHEDKQRYDLETIQKWRSALSHVADISGIELKACNGDEEELLDKVVQIVLKKKPPKCPNGLVEKLEEFERMVLLEKKPRRVEAKVMGIVGIGGVGKTTLAEEFFNRKKSDYSRSSFLFHVRENAATMNLHSLQRKLIMDLKHVDIKIENCEEGLEILKNNLSNCEALIILDDVGHADELDAFLSIKQVLHPKSLILVTSCDKHIFRSARIVQSSKYHLTGLSKQHSQELFCSHAFFHTHPPPGYENIVDQFITACNGLPLSLKVFGAMLCGKYEISYWEDLLNGLDQVLPAELEKTLRISYDYLNFEEQQIFLDVACFAIGEDRNRWIRTWKGSGWKGFVGFRNLENRCLVEVDSKNMIRMHDHFRDLGRKIAEASLPRRLWGATIKNFQDLLEQPSSVRGIRMARWSTLGDTCDKGLLRSKSKMSLNQSSSHKVFGISKLQLLEGEGDFIKYIWTKVQVQSPNLIWLCWNACPCSSLPSWIPMEDLRVLRVAGNELKRLWKHESQAPLELRELNIDAPLLEFPKSLGKLKHLEKIVVGTADLPTQIHLATLPEEFCHLSSLKFLELKRCSKLRCLPNSFGDLSKLRQIDLFLCKSLKSLPNTFGYLTNLKVINLAGCESLKMLPTSFVKLTNLQDINLSGCEGLETLPMEFGNLKYLQRINLSHCKRLKRLPNSFQNLTYLQDINLCWCQKLKVLPEDFGNLKKLQRINLSRCKHLEMLPKSFGNLRRLEHISLHCCQNLKMLPDSLGNLTNLRRIDLSRCISLKMLPDSLANLTNLQHIGLSSCESLEMLPNSFENLTNLQHIDLSWCESLKMLPTSFGNLTNLQYINLSGCERLKILPDSLGKLKSLQYIDVSWCDQSCCESLEVLPNRSASVQNFRDSSKIPFKI